MRILHITSSSFGGAGESAKSLNEALIREGLTSAILDREHFRGQPGSLINLGRTMMSKINTSVNQLSAVKDYGFVSPNSINFVNIEEIRKLNPDVIHIHNWYNLLSLDFIKKLGEEFRIVMTLHDTRLISGGCHVLNGCQSYKNLCLECPAVKFGNSRIISAKQETNETISMIKNLNIISPSQWLAHEFETSFPESEVEVIPNLVKEEFLNSVQLEISKNITNICFISAKLDAPFKGLHLLIEALEILHSRSEKGLKISLTVIGNCEKNQLPTNRTIKIKHAGNLVGNDLIAEMQKNQLVVVPSLSDNFPSVVAEAQLLGIPVLGTRVGGIPEMIENGSNGFLCDPNAYSISSAIERITQMDLRAVSLEARKSARMRYSTESILKRHIYIYQGQSHE